MRIWDETTDIIYNPDKLTLSDSSVFVTYNVNSKNSLRTYTVEFEISYSSCKYIYINMGGSSFNYLTNFLIKGDDNYLQLLKTSIFDTGKIKISSILPTDDLELKDISEVRALNLSKYSIPHEVEYFINNEKDLEALLFLEDQIRNKSVDSIDSIERILKSRPSLSTD